MTATLPTLRDLPPNRHAEIRAELERVVSRPARRPWFVPVIAGAAAVVLVVAAVLFLPTEQPESAPPASVREGPPELPPGVTLQERTEIEEKCAPNGEHLLYNAVSDDVGTFALLIGDTSIVSCPVDYPERLTSEGVSGVRGEAMDWLPGPLVVDETAGASRIDGKSAYEMVIGRTRADAARVTMTVGEETVDAVLANNTFIVRMIADPDYSPGRDYVYLHGYDARGNLVDTQNTSIPTAGECYVLPDGRYMLERGDILPDLPPDQFDTANCPPASPWR